MSDFRPSVDFGDRILRVRFIDSPSSSSHEIECVADLTDFEEVVGVEILDFSKQLAGGRVDPVRQIGEIQWSYDGEVDAFYVRVRAGRGQVQRKVVAQALVDSLGRLTELSVPLARAE